MGRDYIALDIETTGLKPERDKIIEIGAAKYVDGKVVDTFSRFVNPGIPLPERIVDLTGITDEMLIDAKPSSAVMEEFLDFVEEGTILGHNINFDYSFLKTAAAGIGASFERRGIDTLKLSRVLEPGQEKKTLDAMCDYFGIVREKKHRALDDAVAAAELYEKLYEKYGERDPLTFRGEDLNYTVKKQEPMTAKQKKYLLDLIQYHKISMEFREEELTKSSASRLIDKIILEHGLLSHK